jgi:hypothetical protein
MIFRKRLSRHHFQAKRFNTRVPATQSPPIVAIIDRNVTPEPGIFPALEASFPPAVGRADAMDGASLRNVRSRMALGKRKAAPVVCRVN